jgi:hypothetical protein
MHVHDVIVYSVQGYHVVKTADIPSLAGVSEVASSCLATAAAIMQLLKETCSSDGASYVLQIDSVSQVVRLYELKCSTPYQEHGFNLQHSPHNSARQSGIDVPKPLQGSQVQEGAGFVLTGSSPMEHPSGHASNRNHSCLAHSADQNGCSSPLTYVREKSCSGVEQTSLDAPPDTANSSAPCASSHSGLVIYHEASGVAPSSRKCPETQRAHPALHQDALNTNPLPTLQQPYARRVARLCYQMSRQLLQAPGHASTASLGKKSHATAEQQQAKRLLSHCLQLADPSKDPELVASALLRSAELLSLIYGQRSTDRTSVPIQWKSAKTHSSPNLSATPDSGRTTTAIKMESEGSRKLTHAARQLSEGLHILSRHAKGERSTLWSTLKTRLCDVYHRLAFENLVQGCPGRSQRCIMLAACHLECSEMKHRSRSEQDTLRRLLRCSGLACLSMVRPQ